jgi:hypothetical protein
MKSVGIHYRHQQEIAILTYHLTMLRILIKLYAGVYTQLFRKKHSVS